MFELFRHPWFKNWGHVIDTDARKVLEELKDMKSPYVKTLRELLKKTIGRRACGSIVEAYFHIVQIQFLFEERKKNAKQLSSKEDYAELILVAKGSISQLGLLYYQLIQQTRKIDSAIRYWEDLSSTRDWIISTVPQYFIKNPSWITSAQRLERLNAMLRHRMELLGRLGSILEKLCMLRRDFSVGRSKFELNTILLTTVAMVTRVVSQIMFPHEFGNHDRTDFLNGKHLRLMSERHAVEFRNKLNAMQEKFRNDFKALKRPSVWRRRWLEVATGGAVVCYFVYFSVTRPGRIGELRRRVQRTSSEFIFEHVTDPISSLWNEIILQKGYDVIDASEVLDSKRSLDIMLRDFLIMQRPGISEVEVDFMCDSGKVIEELSRSYESAIKAPATNFVYGSLVQMLLIQVQFLKYEILTSMRKVDLLVKANHKNIELAATVPAFILAISTYLTAGALYRKIFRLESRTQFVKHVSKTLFDIEQVLNLSEEEELWIERDSKMKKAIDVTKNIIKKLNSSPRGRTIRAPTWDASPVAGIRVVPELGEDEKKNPEILLPEHNELKFLLEDRPCLGISCVRFGELVVLIERLVHLINKHMQYVPKSELRRLQSDLSELLRADLNSSQKLRTVSRIQHRQSFI